MAQGYLSDEAVLAQAVNAANAAVGEMRTVHSKVNMLSPEIAIVNASGSGNMLTQRFDSWNMKFKEVVARLDQLNAKLDGVRKGNIQIDNETQGVTR
ncbi:hypothetical protein [Amycolatopsis sp. CA-230715]|uniref:hypothetical protein n=1 Tax=Amycolatopsis sp. CA-230715 TaxID=2745196 RepID=UPI001C020459|nr:hypothetical protein [Amycolatopsis sp. CA-230715]QWF82754.1 hypothetical protein HUW46_06193 [Amycolatopsis sp. CA-230715]